MLSSSCLLIIESQTILEAVSISKLAIGGFVEDLYQTLQILIIVVDRYLVRNSHHA